MAYSLDLLKHLYRTMLRIRLAEESLVNPILKGDIRTPCHLYSGEEAIATGLCSALSKDDYIFGNHRSHGHYLAKGGSLQAMLAEIYCRETGCSRGRGGSMHLIDPEVGMMGSAPIVAGTISLALGAALAASIRRDNRIAVTFFGDGATGEGALYESMNFASLRKLPLIFACENNLYATHMPIRECRKTSEIYKIAEPFCIKTYVLDGNDVMAVYEAGKEAVEQCRRGDGPVFMEFLTYRFRGHVGPDDNIQGCHTDIRPQKEVSDSLLRDPIRLFKAYLIENELLDSRSLDDIRREIEKEVEAALAFATHSARPKEEELSAYVCR
jgi:acetoin:2,6-dichlorophenolindophenol oxidoreductase subunit alpha